MTENPYERLADALDRLPNGFTRTPSGIEVRILERIFPLEEAQVACQLTGRMEAVEEISSRSGLEAESLAKALFQMARRGLVWLDKQEGQVRFRLAPFIVGIYEASLHLMDRELSTLTEQYLSEGGAQGIMKPQPALHRVVPAAGSVEKEWVLPYDDVRAILLAARSFNVRDCICRVQKDQLGERRCDSPNAVCLNFSNTERSPRPGDISQAEALALLDKVEEVGLVHTVSNVVDGVGYVCNCCGCCCGILRGVTEWGIPESVAYANYYAEIDPAICTDCGVCNDRCQVGAIMEGDGSSLVTREKCIGCGLCVTGCDTGAARLQRKPESEIVPPPATFAIWEQERLRNRGLAG
ncbi:MAG: 4Fe-4S ferredoxin [Chloroflexi bacterium]|nr:4Fe-4S ferredoxin [Chloroflexota bacterium]